jgi:cyclophilin family peptidyl-prolyl cis-trans isomerase
VSGIVFVDANNNGVHDAGEALVPGVSVTLSGSTNLGAAVNSTTTTDANGEYIFFQVQPGTYTLTRGPVNNFPDGPAILGNLGGTVGTDTISAIAVMEGQAAVNYSFSVQGLPATQISLRLFLSNSTPQSSGVFASPGAGSAAVDNTVQPTGQATPGSSSLAGFVVDASGHGLAGAQITLTGTDSTGRDLFLAATSIADGSYQFNGLQAGDFTLNVTGQPSGFRSGSPAVGSAGGQVFRNDQITHISLAPGTSGTGYNFTELPLSVATGSGVALSAALADDTAGPGGTTSDSITSDPSIQGTLVSGSPITSLTAGLDATPTASFVSVLGSLTPSGTFLLNPAVLALVAGGTLANGSHTLHLQATNSQGQTGSFDVSFTLQIATLPLTLTGVSSPPNNVVTTTNNTAGLQGQTSAGVQVTWLRAGIPVATTTADSKGVFSFANIPLPVGVSDFTVQSEDVVGNTTVAPVVFVHETAPQAVATSPVSEKVLQGADTFVDLSSPNLFTSTGFSDSTVQFSTKMGSNQYALNIQLFDPQAPQTVANFFDYITQGSFNSSIFHRLVPGFVLQGGGFNFVPSGTNGSTSPAVNAITPVGPAVPSEFDNINRPNTLGTLAMALSAGPSGTTDNNSATDEFFINLADNTQHLSTGGVGMFTVFGKAASGQDQRIVNTLAAATVTDESSKNSAFTNLPLNNYSGSNFPSDTTAANFDLINTVTVLRRTQQLTYSVVSVSNSAVVTATVDATTFGQLKLTPAGAGTATVVVQAKDLAGQTATVGFTVTVPVFVSSPGSQTNTEGDKVNLQVSASTFPAGGKLTFSAQNLPGGLTINPNTGVISGSIASGASTNSPYTVTVTATDSAGNVGTQTFAWDVNQ